VLLVAGFVALVFLVVWAVDLVLGFGAFGLVVALLVAGGSAFLAYWKSDAVALAMAGAKPADPVEHARLHNLVEGLCIAGGLPKPRVYIVDDPAPNAFATGRNPRHAAVAVTTGLLERMNRVELEGVLAHELSHVKNYDILVSTLAVTMVGVVALLADFAMRVMFWTGTSRRRSDRGNAGAPLLLLALVLLVFAPLVAKVMQLAVSRRRESLADVTGVQMTRYPPGLVSALEKLRHDSTVVRTASRATAHLWIEEPLALDRSEGRLTWLNRLFMTHPPLDERIRALKEL
jgi:heat shock protein HtpX